MQLLVTGGTGFIGQALIKARLLAGDEVTCLTRNRKRARRILDTQVNIIEQLPDAGDYCPDAVVNLAGAGIADKRWSDSRKHILRKSRIKFTSDLVAWLGARETKPEVLISGSAIGFYGVQGDEPLSEDGEVAAGFTHELCADWEAAANQATEFGVRVCTIRTGVVIGQGGALAKMLLPFKLGLGGRIGNGEQWISWIHLKDEVEIISMLLTHPQFSGSYNLTAPEPVKNTEFTRTLGEVLGRPTLFPMPAFAAKLMLGEGAELLLEGQRVIPERLQQAGYQFHYPQLREAFAEVLTR